MESSQTKPNSVCEYCKNALQKSKGPKMAAGGGTGRSNTRSDEETNRRNEALKPIEKKEATQLIPEKVDFHVKENREHHHTDEYNIDDLIVRRGQEFVVTVTFDRPFESNKHQFILQLTFGKTPKQSKNTLIRVKQTDQLSTSSWGMRIVGSYENTVCLAVMSPAHALVGEYSISVETKTKKSVNGDEYLTCRKKLDETFIVLFNAWCKDDTVYMENDEHRQEYVMNDKGRIWKGTKHHNKGSKWYFGQFEDVSLKSCLYILDICQGLRATARGNPVLISRVVTQMANANDNDGGILVGNWSGDYKDGASPSSWSGSVAILKEYFDDKPEDGVKYGQCWVYSGLVTTLLRAIGIPTRSVTNFASAHDTDCSMTIDYHFNIEDEPIDDLNDSVWNFHVWNESFFKRPDLNTNDCIYDGWQVIDATPQESSQGVMCCGPCSIRAIKEGKVYLPYDTGFLFGEVNGDQVYWKQNDDGEFKVIWSETSSIGKCISAKAVGSNDREDLTDYYKYKEGSPEERAAAGKAHSFSSKRDDHIYTLSAPITADVIFDFVQPDGDLIVGSDFDVQLKIKNTSNEERTIKHFLNTKMAFYTGCTAAELNKLRGTVVVEPLEEKVVSLPVPASDYLGKTPAEAKINAYLTACVDETGQGFKGIESIELQKPQIQVEVPKEIIEKTQFDITFHFTNPLGIPLENGVFNIQSSRHVSPDTVTVKLREPVLPHERAEATVTFEAQRSGWRDVNAKFSSDQLCDVETDEDIPFKVQY